MPRRSRKGNFDVLDTGLIRESLPFRSGLYARLSVETKETEERDSIGMQVLLLKEFAASMPDISVYDVYVDDDMSGTDFHRPEFERMLKDAKEGKINCIIVKDLSRFARNHLGAGEYLDKVFPQWGVRFIAITDQIDTFQRDGGILIPFKNVINERYAIDIARKIQTSIRTMQQKGLFCGARPVYGYKRCEKDKHKLEVDEEAALTVKQIFGLYLQGNTIHSICKLLEADGVLSPAAYFIAQTENEAFISKEGQADGKKENQALYHWNPIQIKRILTSQLYCGDMVQGRTNSLFLAEHKKGARKQNREEDYFVVPNTHKAIIERSVFEMVQGRLRENTKIRSTETKNKETQRIEFQRIEEKSTEVKRIKTGKTHANCLEGIIRCAYCGASIIRRLRKTKLESRYVYVCPKHDQFGKTRCIKKEMQAEIVEDLILLLLKRYFETFLEAREQINLQNSQSKSMREYSLLERKKQQIQKELCKLERDRTENYVRYREHHISESTFCRVARELQELETNRLENCRQTEKRMELLEANELVPCEFSSGKMSSLSKELVQTFIQKIVVDNEGRFEIEMKVNDEYEATLRKMLLQREGEKCPN